MLVRRTLLFAGLLCVSAFGPGCEAEKPIRGSESSSDSSASTTTDAQKPKLPTSPTDYVELLKLANVDRTTLPNVEIDVKGKGKILVELVPQLAPNTCKRISELINQHYYDGQRYHRVENWVVQWGDPQSKAADWKSKQLGTQGTGKIIDFDDNWIRQDRGVLAMARTAQEKNGDSQMYILKKHTPQLTHDYVAFGWVIKGMEVVDKLVVGDQIVSMKFTRQ